MKKIIPLRKKWFYKIFHKCELRRLDICYTKEVEGVGIYLNNKKLYVKTVDLPSTYSQEINLFNLVKDLGYRDIQQFFIDYPNSFSGYIVD